MNIEMAVLSVSPCFCLRQSVFSVSVNPCFCPCHLSGVALAKSESVFMKYSQVKLK